MDGKVGRQWRYAVVGVRVGNGKMVGNGVRMGSRKRVGNRVTGWAVE